MTAWDDAAPYKPLTETDSWQRYVERDEELDRRLPALDERRVINGKLEDEPWAD